MRRIIVALFPFAGFFFAGLIAASPANAQCRGGGGAGGTTGTTTGTTSGSGALNSAALGGGAQLLRGPGSLAYDMMMSQMIGQQMARQQTMLAMQQQKVKEQKLADRRYRAEQMRAQVVESRAKTRAALAAAAGMPVRKSPDRALVAYQPR
jgi:hypothetical protein